MVILWYYNGIIIGLCWEEEGRIIGFIATERYTLMRVRRFAECSLCLSVFY